MRWTLSPAVVPARRWGAAGFFLVFVMGFFSRLKSGLARTRVNIVGLFSGGVVDEEFFESLEETLIAADVGYKPTSVILQRLRDTVKLKAAYCDPRNLETTLTYMDHELRASLERPLRRFVEMATAHDPGKVMDSLSRAASLASSAIIMDPESTRHFGPKKVMEGFGMIPSYDAFSGHHRCVLVPSQLSPEMISQFPSDAGLDEILSMVTNECQMEEVSVTVYLFDLLTCFGNYERKQPEAIQSIPGHHRFRMPFCIQDLLEDSATNQRIQKFLDECQRSC